ncbi:hypothetical protein G8C15_17295 [Enterococcus casseliflavus]|nr:hypothetical protein [Enterococcus casseliflavus]MBF0015414.1 hypothetical protein [Enterococcus casseliflavus]
MMDETNQKQVHSPINTLNQMRDYFTSIYKVNSGTIHHIRDEFKNDYKHTKDIYESLTDELRELWRLEERNQGRYQQALKLQEQITELYTEIHTLHGEVGYQQKRQLPSREAWEKRCERLNELKNEWYSYKDIYSKLQISEENYVDNQKAVFNLRMMVIKSGYIDIDLKDLNREYRNLQKKKLDLTLKNRIRSIKSESVKTEHVLKNYIDAKNQNIQRIDSHNLKRIESFEEKFNLSLGTIEQSIKNLQAELEKDETKELMSNEELRPVESELKIVEKDINQSRKFFSQLIVEERKKFSQQESKAVSIVEETNNHLSKEQSIEFLRNEQRVDYKFNLNDGIQIETKRIGDKDPEDKRSIRDLLSNTGEAKEKLNKHSTEAKDQESFAISDRNSNTFDGADNLKNDSKKDGDKESSIFYDQFKGSKEIDDKENSPKLSSLQRIKNLMKPHYMIGLFRFFIHIWPLTTWPLCTLWVAMILPGPYLLLYGTIAAGLLYSAINLSFYIPKLITFLIQRRQNKKLQKENELKQASHERMKEKSKDRNYSLINERKIDHSQYSQERTHSTSLAEERQSKGRKIIQTLKENGPTLSVMVLGSAVIGGLGVFLMPAILGASMMPLIVGGTFTLGTLALIGTSASILTQIIDKYALEKLQDRFKENIGGEVPQKALNIDIEREKPKESADHKLSIEVDVTKDKIYETKDISIERQKYENRQSVFSDNGDIKNEKHINKSDITFDSNKNNSTTNKIITHALVHEPKSNRETKKDSIAKQALANFQDKKEEAFRRSETIQKGGKNEIFELSR